MILKDRRKHIVAWLLIIIWLLSSTDVIARIYNRNVTIKNAPEYNIEQLHILQFSLDEIYVTDSIFQSVNILGWAVCPFNIRENDQEVTILLQSSEQTYEINTKPQFRSDLFGFFQQQNITVTGKYHGFSVDFCPYFIRNGIYDICLVIQVDGETIGWQKTSYMLKKDNQGITVEKASSQLMADSLSATYEDSSLAYYVDSIEKGDNILTVTGWLYLPQETIVGSSTLIGLTTDAGRQLIYKAVTYSRADLLSITTEENCIDAGFRIEVPLELLDNANSITLDFYKQTDDILFHSPVQQTFELN